MERSPTNGKLPYEVLGIIFENLRERLEDNEANPVQMDRLLLVCRSWAMVARDYRRLWSSIFIRLGNGAGFDFWISYVRTRLERAGPTQALHIALTCEKPYDRSTTEAELETLLCMLTGPTGDVASRWKMLVFKPRGPRNLAGYEHFLSFPTPGLEILRISRVVVSATSKVLPDTSSLSELYMFWCSVPPIQDVSSLTSLELISTGSANAHLLECATQLKRYRCTSRRDWNLTKTLHLPRLLALDTTSPLSSGSIDRLVLPNLVSLRVRLRSSSDISRIMDAPGLPLGKLKKLDLCVRPLDQETNKEDLRRLLLAAPNLQELKCSKASCAITLLNLLLEMDHLYQTPGFHFACKEDAASFGAGEDRQATIVRLLKILEDKK